MSPLCTIPGCRIRGRHLTTCEDEKCGGCLPRLAEDGYSCPRCASVAAENLGTVAEVALAVSDAANRLSSGSGGGGSGKPGSRLPLDLGARSRLDGVEGSLYGWARHVAEERGVRPPGLPVAPKPTIGPVCRTRYECTHGSCKAIRDPAHVPVLLAVVAGWLAGHLDWLAHRPEAGEAFADFTACARALRGVVRGPAEQRFIGPCEACDGDVYVRDGADTGRCKNCGHEVDRADREQWLDEVRREWLFTAKDIADAYGLNVKTIRSWADRGHLIARGADRDGRPLYNVGDVLDLAAGDAARRETMRADRARRAAARAAESEQVA